MDTAFRSQLKILFEREIQRLESARLSLIALLIAPMVFGGMGLVSTTRISSQPFDFISGTPTASVVCMLMLALSAFLSGLASLLALSNTQNSSDLAEARQRFRLDALLSSKMVILFPIAAYQALLLTLLFDLAIQMPEGSGDRRDIFFTVFLETFSAMVIGLIISLLTLNNLKRLGIAFLITLVVIGASNILIALPRPVPYVSPTYTSFSALIMISGIGSDISQDLCWVNPENYLLMLTLEEKLRLDCDCMGISALYPQYCNFPGTGRFISQEILLPKPVPPKQPGPQPEVPEIPDPPNPPDPNGDETTHQLYEQSMLEYERKVEELTRAYNLQLTSYRLQNEIYRSQLVVFEQDLEEWNTRRNKTVSLVENEIANLRDKIGWAFVDKQDSVSYRTALHSVWLAQVLQSLVFFAVLSLLLKSPKLTYVQ